MKPLHLMLTASVMILAGCVEYDERIDLDATGQAGSVRMRLALAEQLLGWPAPKSQQFEDVFPLTVAELRKELDSPGLHLLDARAERSNELRQMYLLCRLDDINRLTQSPAFSQRKVSVKPLNDGGFLFTQELTVSESSLGEKGPAGILRRLEAQEGGHEQLVAMLSKFHLTFSVSAPEGFTASSHTGVVHRVSAVVWRKSLADLLFSAEPWKMEASFVKTR